MNAVEATVRSWSKRANGEVAISIVVHRDNAIEVSWVEPGMRVAVGLARINDDETIAKPDRNVHNAYSRRAGMLSSDRLFWRYIEAPREDPATFAASYIRNQCKVTSRRDILPGTEAAATFDSLELAFKLWANAPRHVENA